MGLLTTSPNPLSINNLSIVLYCYNLSFETWAHVGAEVASELKPDGKGMKEACLDKMVYVQDSDAAKQIQGASKVLPECVIVWAVNKDWHQHVARQSYGKETLMGVS